MGTVVGDNGWRGVDKPALSTDEPEPAPRGVCDGVQRARAPRGVHAATMARRPQSTALITTTTLFNNLQMGKALL